MHRRTELLIVLAALTLIPFARADETVLLGDLKRVEALFSYPNNCNTVCYKRQTLDDTVSHYLSLSMMRDGFGQNSVKVISKDGKLYAQLAGNGGKAFGDALTKFLEAGDNALVGANRVNADGNWRYNWYFLLPLGVPITNNRTVELMNFPPDYLLLDKQDYLISKTSDHWMALLKVNGLTDSDLFLYSTILDIAPIGAPPADGNRLSDAHVYDGYFDPYVKRLLPVWTHSGDASPRPVVVFGSGVREWVGKTYGVNLKVLDTGTIQLPDAHSIRVMGANHPSYIFYAAKKCKCESCTEDEENFALGFKVMKQDLIVARWQVRMGKSPGSDPSKVKEECQQFWDSRDIDVCKLLETQIYKKNDAEAATVCSSMHLPPADLPSDENASKVERAAPLSALLR